MTVFDYDRLGIQRGSLNDPEESEEAAARAKEAEENAATEITEESEEKANEDGTAENKDDLIARIKQVGAMETPPELLRAVERRKGLQRWLTFKKVKQSCPTFPFCNHIPPPPPLMPSPIDIARPKGLVHYPFIPNGQTPKPAKFETPSKKDAEAAKDAKDKDGKPYAITPVPLGKQHPRTLPSSAVYAVGKLPARWSRPFQRASGNPYEFDQQFYFPPLGRIEAPNTDIDHTRDGLGALPRRAESEDADYKTTPIGDIVRAQPTLGESREIRRKEDLHSVERHEQGIEVEGTSRQTKLENYNEHQMLKAKGVRAELPDEKENPRPEVGIVQQELTEGGKMTR